MSKNDTLLRTLIREILIETWWEETYDKDIVDDPAYKKKSKLVPDDIKAQITDYFSSMGLSRPKRKKKKADSYSEEKP